MKAVYKFRDMEIGEYFREDSDDVYECFQKVSQTSAISLCDGFEVIVGEASSWLVLDHKFEPAEVVK